jgi:UDP-N-acetylmuramoyl-tripeptide--D-alanyl-D-alanine ligase
MLELGRYSAEEHERIGVLAASRVDILVAVGVRSRATATAARAAGMREDQVFSYDTSGEAAEVLEAIVQEGDTVLIKGSQSIRTERIAERLLRSPEDQSRLVRQETEWKAR